MLKTSPILSSSANASPAAASFRHASSSNICVDPPPSAPLSSTLRRASSRSGSSAGVSVTSPVSSRLIRHASMDSLSASGRRPSSSQNVSSQPPPSPRPHAMAKGTAATATSPPVKAPAPPPQQASQPPLAEQSTSSVTASAALSPVKRRSSISPKRDARQTAQPSAASASSTDSSSLKRAKPEEQPPKVLPKKYEFCPVEDIVELISQMLAELITTNDAIQISSNGALTRFHSRTPPGISVRDYLQRLARHATLPSSLLLVMVYYIDRLCAMYPDFTINTLTVHRFLITAATVAAKGLSDSFWNNTTYARVGGVRLAELKLLELEFLHRVDWKIVPNPPEILDSYYRALIHRTPGYVLESTDSSESSADDEGDDESESDSGDAEISPHGENTPAPGQDQ